MPSTNITLYLESIKSSKAPYYCPFQNCIKTFRKIDALKLHLNQVDHAMISPTPKSPRNTNSVSDKRKISPIKSEHQQIFQRLNSHHHSSPLKKNIRFIQFKYNDQLETLSADQQINVKVIPKPIENNENHLGSNSTNDDKKRNRSINKSKSNRSSNSKTSNANIDSKLPEPSYRLINSSGNDYKEPQDSSAAYHRFLDDSIEEDDQIKVEYDMDEEDAVWLDIINKKRREDRLLDVDVETFELIMDRFEKESFFQNQNCGTNINSAIDEDAVCSICFDGECHNSNAILFCDMCNIAVHQECYGVPYIPEGLWLCRRCLRSPSKAVDCVLCPNKGGAFKHTDDNRWAHVICALWIPEVGFSNSVFLEPIDSINAIPTARWKLCCSICHKKNVGACIQCYKGNCYAAFHVTCAQQAGLYMKIEAVKEVGRVGMNIKKTAYCLNHAPVSKNGHTNGIYLSDDDNSNKGMETNRKDGKVKSARKMASTSQVSVSIPTIPNERLSKISELVSFPRRNEFLIRLYAYWKLKRQSRCGVPLLRRLQYTNSTMRIDLNKEKSKRDSMKIKNQYKKLLRLRRDLERARLLLELIRKRERIKLKMIRESKAYFIYKLVPFKMFLLHILDKVVEKDTNQFFLEPVNVQEVPDYLYFIEKPMDLGTMRKKVESFQYQTFQEFEDDLNLIVNNCTHYNDKDTVWHKAALKLKTCIDTILDEHRPYLANYHQRTGLHMNEYQTNNSQDGNESMVCDDDLRN